MKNVVLDLVAVAKALLAGHFKLSKVVISFGTRRFGCQLPGWQNLTVNDRKWVESGQFVEFCTRGRNFPLVRLVRWNCRHRSQR